MRTTLLPQFPCPNCCKPLNCVTDPRGNATPKPGDVTVCGGCATPLRFDENMKPEECELSELHLPAADEDFIRQMQALIKANGPN